VQAVAINQGAGTQHGALFIGGRQQDQRLFQVGSGQAPAGLNRQCQE